MLLNTAAITEHSGFLMPIAIGHGGAGRCGAFFGLTTERREEGETINETEIAY
jgi:hypothetical protein